MFFRIQTLLQLDCKLYFITDGKPPKLKYETIVRRQQLQNPNLKNISNEEKCPKRSKFQAALNECLKLVEIMGLPTMKPNGEAEAFCAKLNEQGVREGGGSKLNEQGVRGGGERFGKHFGPD